MALLSRIKRQVTQKIEEYEGRADHFYLDSVGKVTIGVGHMIPTRTAVAAIPMYTLRNGQIDKPATLHEKQNEFDVVTRLPMGYRASWYKSHTSLVMMSRDIDALLNAHISTFYRSLTRIYRKAAGYPDDFDRLPENVQLALFDMIFNLGPTRLTGIYQKLDRCIRAEDWEGAARESNRPQVSSGRNRYVRELFLSAARMKDAA